MDSAHPTLNHGLDEIWNSLIQEWPGHGLVRRRLASSRGVDLFAFVEPSLGQGTYRRGFNIVAEGSGNQVEAGLPDVFGLITRTSFDSGTRISLIVAESHLALGAVFVPLADDLVRHTMDTMEDIFTVVARRLRLWRDFFLESVTGLSENQQVGLFAELEALVSEFIPRIGVERAVSSWFGPEGAAQDFADERLAVEVKATAASAASELTISSEIQLDDSIMSPLLLLAYSVDSRDSGSGRSLPDMVDHVRMVVAASESSVSTFEDRLLKSGYIDAHRSRYTKKYRMRESQWMNVSGKFPRLRRVDLPEGVGKVKYRINLSACRPWFLLDENVDSLFEEVYSSESN